MKKPTKDLLLEGIVVDTNPSKPFDAQKPIKTWRDTRIDLPPYDESGQIAYYTYVLGGDGKVLRRTFAVPVEDIRETNIPTESFNAPTLPYPCKAVPEGYEVFFDAFDQIGLRPKGGSGLAIQESLLKEIADGVAYLVQREQGRAQEAAALVYQKTPEPRSVSLDLGSQPANTSLGGKDPEVEISKDQLQGAPRQGRSGSRTKPLE